MSGGSWQELGGGSTIYQKGTTAITRGPYAGLVLGATTTVTDFLDKFFFPDVVTWTVTSPTTGYVARPTTGNATATIVADLSAVTGTRGTVTVKRNNVTLVSGVTVSGNTVTIVDAAIGDDVDYQVSFTTTENSVPRAVVSSYTLTLVLPIYAGAYVSGAVRANLVAVPMNPNADFTYSFVSPTSGQSNKLWLMAPIAYAPDQMVVKDQNGDDVTEFFDYSVVTGQTFTGGITASYGVYQTKSVVVTARPGEVSPTPFLVTFKKA